MEGSPKQAGSFEAPKERDDVLQTDEIEVQVL